MKSTLSCLCSTHKSNSKVSNIPSFLIQYFSITSQTVIYYFIKTASNSLNNFFYLQNFLRNFLRRRFDCSQMIVFFIQHTIQIIYYSCNTSKILLCIFSNLRYGCRITKTTQHHIDNTFLIRICKTLIDSILHFSYKTLQRR